MPFRWHGRHLQTEVFWSPVIVALMGWAWQPVAGVCCFRKTELWLWACYYTETKRPSGECQWKFHVCCCRRFSFFFFFFFPHLLVVANVKPQCGPTSGEHVCIPKRQALFLCKCSAYAFSLNIHCCTLLDLCHRFFSRLLRWKVQFPFENEYVLYSCSSATGISSLNTKETFLNLFKPRCGFIYCLTGWAMQGGAV